MADHITGHPERTDGGALSTEDVRVGLKRESSAARKFITTLRLIGFGLIGASILGLAVDLGSDALNAGKGIVGLVVILLAVIPFIGVSFVKDDIAQIEFRIAAVEAEEAAVTAALRLAASDVGYAVFLRSFDAERAGLGQTGLAKRQIALGLESMRNARHGMPISEDCSHLEANWRWRHQLDVLKEMKRRAPTILLGNTRLAPDMRAELAATGAMVVTIQARDWWQVFLSLADRARIVVFYIEQATPNLMREMAHIRGHGVKYVIAGDPSEITALGRIPEIGEQFAAGAMLVARTTDLDSLRLILDGVLGAPA